MKIIGKVPIWILLCLTPLSQSTEALYTCALPSISKHFNVTGGIAQSTSTAYFIGFALGIFILGRWSDIFGRRIIVLSGMGIYAISSIMIAFSNNIWLLIALRFCQAFGASVGSVVAQAMTRDSYQGWQLAYVYSSVSIGIVLFPSISSIIGGYVVEYYGVKYVFLLLSVVSTTFLILYLKYLPETNSYIGVAYKHRYLTVFKIIITDKIVLLHAFIVGAYTGMMYGFYIEAPFIFIDKTGLTPSDYGKLGFCLTSSGLIGSFINSRLLKARIKSSKIVTIGLALSLIACLSLNFSSLVALNNTNQTLLIFMIFIPMMLQMLSHTIVLPIMLRYALEDYYKITGTAGSIFGCVYYSIVVLIVFAISKFHSSETIMNFTLLFFALSSSSCIAFYLIQKWHPIRQIYEFN